MHLFCPAIGITFCVLSGQSRMASKSVKRQEIEHPDHGCPECAALHQHL